MVHVLKDLLIAVQCGDPLATEAALDAGVDINGRVPRTYETPGKGILIPHGGKPPLYLAVEERYPQIVKLLLDRGADADALTEHSNFFTGEAALHLAARRGDVELARLLLEGGATPHIKQKSRTDVPGKYAVQLAAKHGHLELVKLLSQMKSTPTENAASAALYDAAEHGRLAVTRCLIEHGADVNKPLRPPDWTPLMMACFGGFAPVAQGLIEAGADLRIANRKGFTAMMMVVHGARMAPENNRDVETPRDHNEVARLLIALGVQPHEGSYQDRNPLEWAEAYADMHTIVRRLLPVLNGEWRSNAGPTAAGPPSNGAI